MSVFAPGAVRVRNLNRKFLNAITRIAGDDGSHLLSGGLTAQLTPTDDAALNEGSPNNNLGVNDFMNVGNSGGTRRRSLLRFDFTSYSSIVGATLFAYNYNDASITASGTVAAYRILSANASWQEGNGGGVASNLECSWNHRNAGPSGGELRWAGDTGSDGGTDAGCGTAGTDHASTALGSVNWTDGVAEWLAIEFDAAELASMVSDNHGIVLKATDEATSGKLVILRTKEFADDSYHPYILLEYGDILDTAEAIFLIADDVGATVRNAASAGVDDMPIPTGGIEVPIQTGDSQLDLSVYVPTGVNVWWVGLATI